MSISPTPLADERFDVRPALLLVLVLFLNLLPRVLLSPLLLEIEAAFDLSRAESSGLFLFVSVGFSITMLLSGFVAERLHHRGTIVLSLSVVGAASVLLAAAPSASVLRVLLFVLGMGAGLYAPSGIATLTGAAHARHWGKALALHEVGPILGFFAAPVIAEAAIQLGSWRLLFAVIGIACFAMAIFYRGVSRGGRFPGSPPNLHHVRSILAQRTFWVVALLFMLALGLEIGVFALLPTFLIERREMTSTAANSLVSVSRLTALLLVFGSGVLADRFGAKRLLTTICLLAGVATALIGISRGSMLYVVVVVQPMLIAAFFPAALVLLSSIAAPESRNVVISLVIPISYLFGAGAAPFGIGLLSEAGAFGAGFVILGMLMMASTLLLRFLPRTPVDNSGTDSHSGSGGTM
ncbi:MAG: MFS transporter [Spirochaetaceae bacterium]|nr:MAG: MFS transporter [Spirochaetaceae bacterium]